ncbi:MAG: VOC family protein [Chloroflexota bacterium]
MPNITRILTNICSSDLSASRQFYTTLFNFEIAYDSDWFVQLNLTDSPLELGIIANDHEIVPEAAQGNPSGLYITFVVDDVETVLNIAKANGFDIVQEPKDTFYGQRRMLLNDPDGVVVDVSSLI